MKIPESYYRDHQVISQLVRDAMEIKEQPLLNRTLDVASAWLEHHHAMTSARLWRLASDNNPIDTTKRPMWPWG